MRVPISQSSWLPVLLLSASDFVSPVIGVGYGASGLVVKRALGNGSPSELTLTASNWIEHGDGIYAVKFDAADFASAGLFVYWVVYPGAIIYPGAVRIIVPPAGEGAVAYPYTIMRTDTGLPIADAEVWVTTDEAGGNVVAGPQFTNSSGLTLWYLDPGTYYFWVQKSGYNFTNPDKETVSA